MNKKQGFDWNKKWGPGNDPTNEDIEKNFEEKTGIPVSFHWENAQGEIVLERSKAKKGVLTPKNFVKKEVSVEVVKQKGEIVEGDKQISWGKFSDQELISNSRDFSDVTQQDLNNNNNNNNNPWPIIPVVGVVGIVALCGLIVYKLSRKKVRR